MRADLSPLTTVNSLLSTIAISTPPIPTPLLFPASLTKVEIKIIDIGKAIPHNIEVNKKKNTHYTFVMVPHNDHHKMHSLKVPAKLVHGIFLVVVFIAGILIGSVGYNVFLSAENVNVKVALTNSTARANRVDFFESESNKLKSAVLDMHLRNNQLRKLLGLKLNNPSKNVQEVVDNKQLSGLDPKEKAIYKSLSEASSIVEKNQKQLKELKAHVNDVYSKMASIPSTWPIYGRLSSGYGYRISPWRGFHSGVDINARYGDPIKATAPGLVVYSGWRSGYGKTVIIKHRFGYSTLYAHCSRLLISKGERVKAGQAVARVGTTGYSTGAHLHYEVRKDNRHINPMAFLNLKVLTAARILK